MIVCFLANVLRKKDSKAVNIGDFMPADQKPVDAMDKTWENFKALAKDPRYGRRIDSNR